MGSVQTAGRGVSHLEHEGCGRLHMQAGCAWAAASGRRRVGGSEWAVTSGSGRQRWQGRGVTSPGAARPRAKASPGTWVEAGL